MHTKINTLITSKTGQQILFALPIGLFLVFGLRMAYGVGVDWDYSYDPAMKHFLNYYDHSDFAGFPWLLFFLPHGLLSLEWGNAINMTLNIIIPLLVIMRFNGGWQAVALVFTAPFFLDLVRTNNVEWIPLMAFLLPLWMGLPFLISKPQTVGGAALIWLKRNWRRPLWLVPAGVMVLLALFIWGIKEPIAQIQEYELTRVPWNFAPFPFGYPIGFYLLYMAWKKDDEYIGAAASPFLVPYFAAYSMFPLMTILSCRSKRDAFYVWAGFWIYFIVEARRIAYMGTG